MDEKCLICLVNAPKKEQLLINCSLQLENLKERIIGKDIILLDNEQTISKLEDENQKINLHLVQARRNVKIFGLSGLAIGVVATAFLLK